MSPKNWVIADSISICFRFEVLGGESIAKLLISKMLCTFKEGIKFKMYSMEEFDKAKTKVLGTVN